MQISVVSQAERSRPRGVFVTLFCGAGGDSTGVSEAFAVLGLGRARKIAVNHDPLAIRSHLENNEDFEHYDCDVEKLNPDDVLAGDKITLLWFSAPCQPYSPANGKKYPFALPYTRPQQRATPAYAVDWIIKGDPLVIIEENVTQIMKKWDGWDQHVKDIEGLGYDVVIIPRMNAADFGVPQDRRRMILIAVKKGYPLTIPKATHSDPKRPKPGTKPWVPARTVVNRALYCPPVFHRKTSTGKPKPLAQSVRNRIGRYLDGLGPFWHILAEAVRADSGPVPLLKALEAVPEDQWPDIIKREGDTLHIRPHDPWLTKFYNNARDGQSLDEPFPTMMAGGGHVGVTEPRVEVMQDFVLGQQGGAVPRSTGKPVPTIPSACYVRLGEFGFILPKRGPGGGEYANPGRPMDRPLNAQLAGRDSSGVVDVGIQVTDGVILPHNGENKAKGQKPRIHPIDKPMPTVCAGLTKQIAFAFLYTYNGKANITGLDRPATTITTVERHAHGEVQVVVKARIEDCYLTVGLRMLEVEDEQAPAQSFPRGYRFIGTKRDKQRQVGNAVPPRMAYHIAKDVLEPLLEAIA